MIRLTLLSSPQASSGPPTKQVFNQHTVTIGCGAPPQVDFPLPDPTLQIIHVQIFLKEGCFFALNQANDPFVTLNGLPFWKKPLNNGDHLNIGGSEILFECEQPMKNEDHSVSKAQLSKESEPLEDIFAYNAPLSKTLEQKISQSETLFRAHLYNNSNSESQEDPLQEFSSQYDAYSKESLYNEIAEFEQKLNEYQQQHPDQFSTKNEQELNINELMQEVEELESSTSYEYPNGHSKKIQKHQSNHLSTTTPFSQKEFLSLSKEKHNSNLGIKIETSGIDGEPPFDKDDSHPDRKRKYLLRYDDDDKPNNEKNEQQLSYYKILMDHWRKVAIVLAFVLIILIIGAIAWYASLKEAIHREQMKASHSVADIAMALTAAQIQHIKPVNHNWYDNNFLKLTNRAVLDSQYSTKYHVDTQGNFVDIPYLLRIYTSNDLSRFLLIAQPKPSLMQWLIPRSAILVDSESMELRKIQDLKALNRHLIASKSLDGLNRQEIIALVQQGELIQLSTLAKETNSPEFAPPAELAFLKTGAENKIYNSPRYYKFSEPILKAALDLANSKEIDLDLALLAQELHKRSKLQDMVLYTSQGLEKAVIAKKVLMAYSLRPDSLLGYVTFHPDDQLIINSHLVLFDPQNPTSNTLNEKKSLANISRLIGKSVASLNSDEVPDFELTQESNPQNNSNVSVESAQETINKKENTIENLDLPKSISAKDVSLFDEGVKGLGKVNISPEYSSEMVENLSIENSNQLETTDTNKQPQEKSLVDETINEELLSKVDKKHPLYIQLKSLALARQKAVAKFYHRYVEMKDQMDDEQFKAYLELAEKEALTQQQSKESSD